MPVLKVENLSKLYRLGEFGTGTISHDLNRWWARVRGKEDPYAIVGQTNDRSQKAESDYVWALKDINFEVEQGEILGIIGRNGAGKSTLLKILSQITSPTTGEIKTKGRIASLLEVGTGMHPEMTARENIYLNGAILGMTKKEIAAKFDEIIDFSGCTMYVDTPLKRFSSGMRVRLGFAVAAFLEPEILIVDEVLAVGDAEFQKKAIGKMKDISEQGGRTVLFVSHNMSSIKSLCHKSLLLKNGEVESIADTDTIINLYLKGEGEQSVKEKHIFSGKEFVNLPFKLSFLKISGKGKTVNQTLYHSDESSVECEYINSERNLFLSLRFKDSSGGFLFVTGCPESLDSTQTLKKTEMIIPKNFFNTGRFYMDVQISDGRSILYRKENAVAFDIIEEKKLGSWNGRTVGALKPSFKWRTI
ncbi:MAG: ABC transporter ATP-binding protein [Bacteroidota bacterium]